MKGQNHQQSWGSVYAALDSSELEQLPRAAVIHHATRVETDAEFPQRELVFGGGQVSICDRRLTLVLPRRFDITDPDACPRCLEAVIAGVA